MRGLGPDCVAAQRSFCAVRKICTFYLFDFFFLSQGLRSPLTHPLPPKSIGIYHSTLICVSE